MLNHSPCAPLRGEPLNFLRDGRAIYRNATVGYLYPCLELFFFGRKQYTKYVAIGVCLYEPLPRLEQTERIALTSQAPIPCRILRQSLSLRQNNKLRSRGLDDGATRPDYAAELALARSATENLRAEVTRLRRQPSTDAEAGRKGEGRVGGGESAEDFRAEKEALLDYVQVG